MITIYRDSTKQFAVELSLQALNPEAKTFSGVQKKGSSILQNNGDFCKIKLPEQAQEKGVLTTIGVKAPKLAWKPFARLRIAEILVSSTSS